MRDAMAHVTALDISINALKILQERGAEQIEIVRDYVPMTALKDGAYDLVVSRN